jgi:hypothetical protein
MVVPDDTFFAGIWNSIDFSTRFPSCAKLFLQCLLDVDTARLARRPCDGRLRLAPTHHHQDSPSTTKTNALFYAREKEEQIRRENESLELLLNVDGVAGSGRSVPDSRSSRSRLGTRIRFSVRPPQVSQLSTL